MLDWALAITFGGCAFAYVWLRGLRLIAFYEELRAGRRRRSTYHRE